MRSRTTSTTSRSSNSGRLRRVSPRKGGVQMPQAWSDKRERQYEHIEESERKRGHSLKRSKEIAARTVNKERARTGEARRSSRTKEQLYNEAKRMNIAGRSRMNKQQLQRAVYRRTYP